MSRGATSAQTAIRLDPAVLERADALRPFVTELHGKDANRSDVLREAMLRGLRSMEKRVR